jgi:cytochrome oxidase assembly protein ShyY1
MGSPHQGWLLVTPVFSQDKRRAILVRHGWVPDEWHNNPEKLRLDTSGVGVVTGGEIANSFVPQNDPSSGQWFYLNVPQMVSAAERTLPFSGKNNLA